MKKDFILISLFVAALSFAFTSCSDTEPTIAQEVETESTQSSDDDDDSDDAETEEEEVDDYDGVTQAVTIDITQTYQTIKGFGGADAWNCEYVGKYWTSGRERISQYLFSQKIASGNPEGIGLSMWRTNLGGGTAEQGDDSDIDDKTRRASSYLNDDGSYDWTRCEGQRYFLDQALAYEVPSIVLFSNTPPVQYTLNGKGYSSSGSTANLQEDKYDDFADYMTTVAAKYIEWGYPVTHISPVNEPQYDWDDSDQEGSGWTNSEVTKIITALDASLTEAGLSDVTILPGEAGDWEYMYGTKSDADRSNVIEEMFGGSTDNYIGDLAHVDNLVCGHSYWTDTSWSDLQSVRTKLASAATSYGVEVWQSEWSMLGDGYSTSEFIGYDDASEMDIALYMTKVIHNDLTVGGVSSWCFWTSLERPRWSQLNRFLLVSLTPSDGLYGDMENEGDYEATPTLWALGNYSLFIRPGYKRIGLTVDESRTFFGSAYISDDGGTVVAVYSNLTEDEIRLDETHTGWTDEPSAMVSYTTSSSKNLKKSTLTVGDYVYLEPESVTTIVYSL